MLPDIVSLAPGALVTLFVLDTTPAGGDDVLYFHAGTNALNGPVIWQGQAYQRFPIEAAGFEARGAGAAPRPTLTMANYFVDELGNRIYGYMSAICKQYRDLQHARVTRRQVFAKYLDAANFPGGNPNANPANELPQEIWRVDQKTAETNEAIVWELSNPFDLTNAVLPRRPIVPNLCTAVYRDPVTGCRWSPDPVTGPWFNLAGVSVGSASLDAASKRLATCCRPRFGSAASLPFMGFPGTGLV